ncbi:MAG TPA: ABC transporter ATP-binding protein [Candidatus Hydrogenedentes bacterium]|nr:ABC transporter ATP-binding protein [Candidatus Hydrogenedentota bacterium]HOL76137.1 ABC transporter ATP-binding protein [Candidatus Hydrogenedentota bacterium]HPO84751.1 ABC transporter ATP-binding protein [Candidatus Hydrogenedentota bacterium]
MSVLLDVRSLTKHFRNSGGLFSRVDRVIRAVDNVSFAISQGETLGLVGESGCGKTTTGRLILRLMDPTAGAMWFYQNGTKIDLLGLRGESLRRFRKHMQLVFQDPYSSLNPRMSVFDIIAEPLRAQGVGSRSQQREVVYEVSRACGLQPEYLQRYPHAFSGGQRQRVCIARALVLNPEFVVCDEPVSALDVSVQAQILNLLKDLQQQRQLTYLFISHDLAVVENISTRVAVMYAGRIVELGFTQELFHTPLHPYTEALLAAAPSGHLGKRPCRKPMAGEVADLGALPPGCAFSPRCPYAQDVCRTVAPELRDMSSGRHVACWRAEELHLAGISS